MTRNRHGNRRAAEQCAMRMQRDGYAAVDAPPRLHERIFGLFLMAMLMLIVLFAIAGVVG